MAQVWHGRGGWEWPAPAARWRRMASEPVEPPEVQAPAALGAVRALLLGAVLALVVMLAIALIFVVGFGVLAGFGADDY